MYSKIHDPRKIPVTEFSGGETPLETRSHCKTKGKVGDGSKVRFFLKLHHPILSLRPSVPLCLCLCFCLFLSLSLFWLLLSTSVSVYFCILPSVFYVSSQFFSGSDCVCVSCPCFSTSLYFRLTPLYLPLLFSTFYLWTVVSLDLFS